MSRPFLTFSSKFGILIIIYQ